METLNRFYTYAYLREDKTPYYIGKGSRKRAYTRSKRDIKPPKDKSRIILLKQNLTEEEAFKHEKYMIAIFGRKDLGTGILHNKTDGGEGVSGIVITEEIRIEKSEAGKKSKELGVGIHGRTKEQIIEDGRKGAEKQKEIRTGAVYGKSKEQRIENGRTCGNKTKELGIGIHGLTPEQRIENAKNAGLVGGKRTRELGVGICGLTKEQMFENGKRNGNKIYELGLGIHALTFEQRSQHAKKINSQKWMCIETGFISTPGSLTNYQRNRGIDTSKRKRIS
jgi:hypothetical protein